MVLCAAGLCALATAAAAEPPTIVAGFRPIFINARRDAAPKPGTVAALYPEKARTAGIEGRVMLHCQIRPEGRVSDCTVVEEDPADWGFGDVALRTSSLIRQPVPTKDHKVATHGVAVVNYNFTLGDHGPSAETISQGRWEQKPGAAELSAVYPWLAQREFVEGFALIGCKVTADGLLEHCRTNVEEPSNFGFGAAALSLMGKFKLRATMADGTAVKLAGGEVRVPFLFRLPFIPH
ncbi:MAG TPA: TonB family protein [Phenylobacterium sp.]|nr:TonB family protein [Phenylobacterium sp.]